VRTFRIIISSNFRICFGMTPGVSYNTICNSPAHNKTQIVKAITHVIGTYPAEDIFIHFCLYNPVSYLNNPTFPSKYADQCPKNQLLCCSTKTESEMCHATFATKDNFSSLTNWHVTLPFQFGDLESRLHLQN
jgi:hypothetical protein